ncbi:MAG: GNAT family N-acetyltransferase [Anaerolineae bacterium]|jgi:predicted GNAT superfamily acetyltransferase|nr:GNAT family N-acetyltransferase [Anaerolineae bacterium]
MIVCRHLTDVADFEAVVDLEMLVWQMDGRGAVPTHLMQAVAHAGGSNIGAFDGGRLVGFTMAFLARQGGHVFPWSHMAAVHPDYQSRGIGFRLKQAQRDWALQQGYTRIGWTFDPMQRRNAAFNLRGLAGIAAHYHVNFYGEMTDGLNAGLPSDRLEITWRLDDVRVQAAAAGHPAATPHAHSGALILRADADGYPQVMQPLHLTAAHYRAEIPFDRAILRQHDRDRLHAWQQALRAVLQAAFAQHYAAVDFATHEHRCWYVLQRSPY